MTPIFVQVLKIRNPPNFRGEETKQYVNIYVMFYENSFIVAACTLKLRPINPSYLKKLCEWKTFTKLIHLLSAVKYRLDFLFFVDVNLRTYSTLHG